MAEGGAGSLLGKAVEGRAAGSKEGAKTVSQIGGAR
jgi:hypothetical protein